MSRYASFTRKINDQIQLYVANGHDARTFLVDPGKFGRLASKAPLAAKYAACKSMNAVIARNGSLTESSVANAFETAGI